jgi:hypothetical protein
MTKQQKLTKRLIALFPAACLKSSSSNKGSFEELLNQTAQSKSLEDAKQYAIENFDFAKLDVMLFEFHNGSRIRQSDLPDLQFALTSENLRGFNRFFGFPEVSYDVILYGPEDRETLSFVCPVQIVLRNRVVEVRVIKLEKKISSYYPEDRYARQVGGHQVDTTDRIRAIFLSSNFKACDINKGVKHAWDHDKIDARKLQLRNTGSVRTEAMDENEMFKKLYPSEYRTIIDKPLKSTYFRYLKDDKQWPDNLTIDASQGTMSFTKFAHHQNQLDHVVTSILSEN